MSGELFFGLLLTAVFYGGWMAFIHWFMKDVDEEVTKKHTDNDFNL